MRAAPLGNVEELLMMPGEELLGQGGGNNFLIRRKRCYAPGAVPQNVEENLTRVLRGKIPLWLQRGQPFLLLGGGLFGKGELLGNKLREAAALNEPRGLMSLGGRAREDSCP